MKKIVLLAIITACAYSTSLAQTLVHYWNFNVTTSIPEHLTPSYTAGGASLVHVAGGASLIDLAGGTGQNFNVLNLNARNGDVSGNHLRFNNPIGGTLVFSLPTTGFSDVVFKYATRRSGSGAGTQEIAYSTDGINYIPFTNINPVDGDPTLQTLDFSAIAATDNNPDFKIRITFIQGPGGTVGNNRFDNVTLDGTPAGADVNPPAVSFSPTNGATSLPVNTQPTITFNETVRKTDDTPLDNTNVDALVELRLNNAAGAVVAFDATVSGSTITITPSSPLAGNQPYYVALKANEVEDLSNNAITTVQSSTFTTIAPGIAFNTQVLSVAENAGQVSVQLNLSNPSVSSVKLVVKPAPFSTAGAADATISTQTLHFTGASNATQTVNIPIVDDGDNEQDEYLVLALEDASGLSVTGTSFITIYIRDNDRQAPVPNKQVELTYMGSYDPSGSSNASSEIVVYDSASRRLFVISALQNRLDIADFSNPAFIQPVASVDMTQYGGITSVAVKNGIVVAAAPNANKQFNGSVVFFNTDGVFQKQLTVGALPDMVTFTPDGSKILVANEGEPAGDYSIDPEGSISIIDITGGVAGLSQSHVTTLDFTSFNAQTAALLAAGIRKGFAGSTLSQDLEPEYITFSPDSKTAWVILQEANGFAVVDLQTKKINEIWPLGKKDHNLPGNGFDASDRGANVHISNWPVKGIYMPDGIATYTVGGTTYIVGANEGDDREHAAFNERLRVNDPTYKLDSTVFPNAAVLKNDNNLGRLRVTKASGDTDGDGDFDEIHLIGGRSFAIWNTTTKSVVYDSKDDFEQYLAKTPAWSPIFNTDHESNAFKSRSTSKGPEPEGLALANIEGKQYAFISLERQGGVMVYDITDPTNVKFVDYKNPRNVATYGGDNGPEGIFYIPGATSPDGKHYIVVANEISGSLSIYRLTNGAVCAPVTITADPVNPAPVNNGFGVATFTVQTSGNDPVTYQWQENGVNITNGGVYSDVNTATMKITNAGTGLNGKQYRVIVTNCLGNNRDTSTAATLAVSAVPAVSVADVTVQEDQNNVSVQFCLSATTNKPVTIHYNTSNGTATPILDYIPKSAAKTIPKGQTCTSITIPIIDLPAMEPAEHFFVNITSASEAAIGDGQGKVTILDDDNVTTRKITVTPNPFVNSIRVTIQSQVDEKTLLVLSDASGRPVTARTMQVKKGMNISTFDGLKKLPNGIYFLRTISASGIETHKLVKTNR